MDHNTRADLKSEAEHLYFCLFRDSVPPGLVAHYLNVHEFLAELRDLPSEQLGTIRIIVSKELDASAVEPWLRCKGRRHALSSKLLLVVYLVECGGGYNEVLRKGRLGRGRMVFAMSCGLVGLLRGFYLKVRHGLV